uniref:Secreted RxLR effector protein 20 n=1 Tax=Plasmopara viticola TaxID=143451 RepID=RLR20_PLAVT|nr:RecName: Full=Secreted RxLR effector protein 20; Flags: Precursor [Plasmopara viticola]
MQSPYIILFALVTLLGSISGGATSTIATRNGDVGLTSAGPTFVRKQRLLRQDPNLYETIMNDRSASAFANALRKAEMAAETEVAPLVRSTNYNDS